LKNWLFFRVGKLMLIDKLTDGVLQVDTPIGPRFVRLKFTQRAYLLWMFRNFPSLPHQVLSSREQRLVERLCDENGFASRTGMGTSEAPVIGRIEKQFPVPAEVLTMRKPVAGSKAGVRERESEAASA
jgi:hypothetical protein